MQPDFTPPPAPGQPEEPQWADPLVSEFDFTGDDLDRPPESFNYSPRQPRAAASADPRANHRLFLARARELLEPSPVLPGIPNWFRLKLLRLRRESRGGARSCPGDVQGCSNP